MEKVRVLPSLTNIKINNMKAIVAAIRLSISLMATMMARFAAMKPSLKQQDMSCNDWVAFTCSLLYKSSIVDGFFIIISPV
jgi:hypothetical protein